MNGHLAHLLDTVESQFSQTLSRLLTERFLYQSLEIPTDGLRELVRESQRTSEPRSEEEMEHEQRFGPLQNNIEETVNARLNSIAEMRWMLVDPERWATHHEGKPRKESSLTPFCKLPRFVRACPQCKVPSSPFMPGAGRGYPSAVIQETISRTSTGRPVQTWFLTYQCGSCDNEPLYLMLRRCEFKLSITGRNHFEGVTIPKGIPAVSRTNYREALVARAGGKGLAAALYLRVAIEQYMRSVTKQNDRRSGEELADQYHSLLHPSFPVQFKTMRTNYQGLSVQIHTGEEDHAAFDSALRQIDQHFAQLELIPLPTVQGEDGSDAVPRND